MEWIRDWNRKRSGQCESNYLPGVEAAKANKALEPKTKEVAFIAEILLRLKIDGNEMAADLDASP